MQHKTEGVLPCYNAAALEEDFNLEFLDAEHPGDISVEIICLDSSNSPRVFGIFKINEKEVLTSLNKESSDVNRTAQIQTRFLLDPSDLNSNIIGEDNQFATVSFRLQLMEEVHEWESSLVRLFHLDQVVALEQDSGLDRATALVLGIQSHERIGTTKEQYELVEGRLCMKGSEIFIYKTEDSRSFEGEFEGWIVSVPSKILNIEKRVEYISLLASSQVEYMQDLKLFSNLAPKAALRFHLSACLSFSQMEFEYHSNPCNKKAFVDDVLKYNQSYEEMMSQFTKVDKTVSEELSRVESSILQKAKIPIVWEAGKVEFCESAPRGKIREISRDSFAKSLAFTSSSKSVGESHKKRYSLNQPATKNTNKILASLLSSNKDGSTCSCSYCMSRQEINCGFEALNRGNYLEAKRHADQGIKFLSLCVVEHSENHEGHALLVEKLLLVQQLSLNGTMFEAAQKGLLDVLRKSLDQGADIKSTVNEFQWIEGKGLYTSSPFLRGFNVVHFAVMPFIGSEKQSKLQCLQYLCSIPNCPYNSFSEDGRFAVHVSVREIHCLRYLVEVLKQNPSSRDHFGRTALHQAALYGRYLNFHFSSAR